MFGVHGFWCTLFGVGKNPFQKEKKRLNQGETENMGAWLLQAQQEE